MRQSNFLIHFLLLLFVQICIANFFRLSQFAMLSILPAMILLLPIRNGTIPALFIAFATGLAVDLLSDGLIGLNALALVPVTFCRLRIIRLVFGDEVFARKEDISIPRQGLWKMSVALIMAQALFLIIYIWADGAGTRPLWFGGLRFAVSMVGGYILSLIVAGILAPERTGVTRR
ncbi:MAG: hypothetical protein IKX29_04300 [Bacteroidales bacterium]|nr:hypothetical protein [Bacteroidales bacterium]